MSQHPQASTRPALMGDRATQARQLMNKKQLTPEEFATFRRLVNAGGELPAPDCGPNFSTACIRQWLDSKALQTRQFCGPVVTR